MTEFVYEPSEWAILSGYRGSQAHGTTIPPEADDRFGTDDIDMMDVVVLPPGYYFGLETYGHSQGTKNVMNGPWDVVIYDVVKFVRLLCKGNPNVLTMLWLDDYDVLSEPARLLIQSRGMFTMTQQTITAFMGYIAGQVSKMKSKPTDQAYMGERRRALAEEFGYDVKNASHAIRLAHMLVDLLQTWKLIVNRTSNDADMLIAIKRGQWTLGQVTEELEGTLDMARALEREIIAAKSWPERVDTTEASRLCQKVVWQAWADRL
jgi:predicted nucleotidyltransferase